MGLWIESPRSDLSEVSQTRSFGEGSPIPDQSDLREASQTQPNIVIPPIPDQSDLISKELREAVIMDVMGLESRFGNEYEKGIGEMRKDANELDGNGKV